MNVIQKIKKLLFNFDWFIFIMLFLSYLIPIAIFYFSRNYFAYTNAWDEYTYLSYQGAIATVFTPGYSGGSIITVFLHIIGLSGGVQNLLWDITVPITIFLLGYKIFIHYKIDKKNALFYTSILTFGSVLFNRSNPVLNYFVHMDIPFVSFAMEPYLSILRSPHPQLSYLVIIIFFYLFLRSEKKYKFIYLFLPVPFFYWPVIFPYMLILLNFIFKSKVFKKENIINYLVSNILSFVSIGLLLYLGILFAKKVAPTFGNSDFAEKSISLFISPSIIFIGFLYLLIQILYLIKKEKLNNSFHFLYMTLLSSLIFLSNFQLFAQVNLDPKVFQDTVGTILSSLGVILTFISLRNIFKKYTIIFVSIKYGLLVIILILNLGSQGFSFVNLNFQTNTSGNISSQDIERVKEEPLYSIIPDYNVSSRMTLIKAKINAPLYAYQYNYPFFVNTCQNYEIYVELGRKFVDHYDSASNRELELVINAYELNIETLNEVQIYNSKSDKCNADIENAEIKFVHHDNEYMTRFPNYSPTIQYYINRLTSNNIGKIDYYIYGNWLPKKKYGE